MATKSSPRTFVLASRASQLAQIQTNIVLEKLQALYPDAANDPSAAKFTTSFMATGGDKNQSQALYLIGGKALWTKELEVALMDREVDMLVHSFKDVPTVLPDGCSIAGVLEREDPVDSLVVKEGCQEKWKTLEDLPKGSVVGTSSVRRVAQLKRKYPGLVFQDVRGNLNTRLAKLDAPDSPYAAIILAKAGMVRIGMGHRLTSDLNPPTLFHAVSQGALGIEIRSDDAEAHEFCRRITHDDTEWRCLAERACLRVLEGGCSVPVGVATTLKHEGEKKTLEITGCVTALDGSKHVEHTLVETVDAVEKAEELGAKLARTLIETGAKEVLDSINVDRAQKIKEAQDTNQQIAQ
ncbi:porphobilinogen deaminase [Marasmius tenuissimus]|uniref:hydroxymethylbilane synthase n=1 Tax=Marasmius tenuissimus TaxID=585030 RepID=A0ABR2ZDK5_9AGAR